MNNSPAGFGATVSGGNEITSNKNETMFLISSSGGTVFVVAINPITFTYIAHSPQEVCRGPLVPSKVEDNVMYCTQSKNQPVVINGVKTKATGFTVYKLKWPHAAVATCGFATCPDVTQMPTWSEFLDFQKDCAQANTLTSLTWHGQLSIDFNDTTAIQSFSDGGGQNTGHLFFVDTPGVGCQTIDTQGDGTHMQFYASASASPVPFINGFTNVPIEASFHTIHGGSQHNGWLHFNYEACDGADCTGPGVDAPILWRYGTNIVWPMRALNRSGGHSTLSGAAFIGNSNVAFPLNNLANSYQFAAVVKTPGCSTCRDEHIIADPDDFFNLTVGTTGGLGGELWGVSTLPPAPGTLNPFTRFVKTYTSGINGINLSPAFWNNFQDEYAINGIGARWTVATWTSDMLMQLGQYPCHGMTCNRSDVFAVALNKQGAQR